ncbi:MAG: MBL fold metallo-hydrolase [Pseudomonadota bacterium]
MRRLLKFISIFLLSTSTYADYVEVTLLGTGTPRPSIERFGTSTLVSAGGKLLLFDAGRGVTIRLQQAGITPDRIDHVFLTHLHSDHISGFDDLWITGWIWQRQDPIQVSGPTGIGNFVQSLRQAYDADITFRSTNVNLDATKAEIISQEINEGVVYDQNRVKVTAFLVDHEPVEPAYGYRIDFGDRSIVISGDTTYSENLVKHSKKVDLLLHEIADASQSILNKNKRLDSVLAYHTTPTEMVSILKQTQPRLAVLNHLLLFGLSPEDVIKQITEDYKGKVEIGYDLMKISIGNKITTQSLQ